jgi:hypothetical protein
MARQIAAVSEGQAAAIFSKSRSNFGVFRCALAVANSGPVA